MMNEYSFDSGFSTIEALVSIALISIAGALMLWVSTVSIQSLGASQKSITLAADVLSIDTSLRSAANLVRIPWWERRVRTNEEGSSVSVAWLEGKPNEELTIREDQGYILVTGADDKTIFRSRVRIDSLAISPIADDDGVPRGLEIRYDLGGETFVCNAPFASRALGVK